MKKKKVLYIATTADKRNRLDGETIKCRLLKEYLCEIENIQVIAVDTDNWRKHILKLVVQILMNYFFCEEIIVSSADNGAHIVLDFFRKIKSKKNIYYFVVGGSLARNIKQKKWKIQTYNNIEQIYVEASKLKEDLHKLGIKNVKILNNFRRVKNIDNKYKKSNTIKFVFYGRVIKEKGIEEAIKLITKLNAEKIECTLDIYGQCKDEYLSAIKKNFTKNIQYCGEIKPNNKAEYEILSQYDIFILPTEYPGECLPGALIDAYVAELAVVVSNWKYATEYVEDNVNGIIFEYKNYDDMFQKTKKMIQDKKIPTFKQNSKKLSKKYIIDYVLEDFKEEISE